MTPKQTESIIDNILNSNKSSKYYIHRFAIGSVFYDILNGKLYTTKEYKEMSEVSDERYEYVKEYLYPIWKVESEQLMKNHSLDIGAGWSVSEQEYKKISERNFQEHINEFFEKGLYAVETSIERTATSLEEGNLRQKLSIEQQREKLKGILNKPGFGMNTSKENALLGALANREELNALLVLEIPESCFGDLEHISQLFEKSDDILKIMTVYRGIQEIDTVIPKEYIKGAFFIQKDSNILYNNNEHYNSDKKVENGIYNNQSIKTILENLKVSEKVQSEQIQEILEIMKSDFNIDNDIGKLKNRMSTTNELLTKVEDRDSIESLNTIIEEVYESIRNPLEKEFEKITQLDFSKLSADEVANHIQDFVLNGSDTLRKFREQKNDFDFDMMLKMYRKGLEILCKDALRELSQDYRANNANAMVRGKIADLDRLTDLKKQIEPLDDLEIFGKLQESDKKKYEDLIKEIDKAKDRVSKNSIVDLEKNAFLREIEKATINVPIELKDRSKERVKRDQLMEATKDKNGNTKD